MRDKHLQTVLAVFASFGLLLAGFFVFPPALAAFAIPLVMIAHVYGLKTLAPGLGVFFLLILLLTDLATAGVVLLIALLFATAIPYAFRIKFDPYQAVLALTLCLLVIMGALSIALHYINDLGLLQAMELTLREVIERQIELLESGGISSIEILNLEYNLRQALDLMIRILPAMLFVVSFFTSLVHYLGSARLLRYRGYGIINAGNFNQFTLPSNIIIGALVTFAGSWLLNQTGFLHTETLNTNLVVIFSLLFLVQGLAVADCFLAKRLRLVTRIVIPLLLVLFLQLGPLYVLLGILDVPLQFRKRITYKRGDE